MTQPGRAGRASIEIVGDVSRLGRQLERDAQRAVNDIDLDTGNISDQLGDAFANGAREGIEALEETLPDAKDHFDKIADYAEEAASSVALDFEDSGTRIRKTFADNQKDSKGFFDRFGESARDAGDDVQTNLLRPLTAGFSRLGEVVTATGSALLGLALTGTNPAGLLSLAITAGAVVTALPVIIGLVAALADLAGIMAILPGAVGALSASLIVGIVAFNGFGDAISAVLDGDPEKIAEAMERLAPAARAVVREFQAVLPIFRSVGDAIQQGFFGQLAGIVERFGQQTLPRLQNELETLAAVMGRAFGGLGNLLNDIDNVAILERLLVSTSRITSELGASFTRLGQAFFNAIDAGLPSLETLSSRLAGAIDSFAAFINASIEDGSFQAFLDDAIATLDELLALGGAVGDLLGVLFGGTDDAGRGFLATLTDITKRMTEFFKSAEGQDTLEDFGEIIDAAGIALGAAANAIVFLVDVFSDLDDAVNATNDWLMQLGADIVGVWNSVVETVSGAIDSIGQFFTETGDAASSWWDDVTQTVSDAVGTVISFVEAIPGRVVAFVESIPARVGAIFDLMIDGIITALAVATATVIVFFTDLPGQITGALVALLGVARETFNQIYLAVLDSFNSIIAFIQSVPGLLAAAWDFIVQQVVSTYTAIRDFIVASWEATLAYIAEIPGRVGAFFQRMNEAATDRVNALIERVKGIPGEIMSAIGDLGRLLYASGGRIIQGLIDGIRSRIGQLRDAIAGAVQEIRDHLPFSPAKKGPLSGGGSPDRAGAVIGSMIASGLDAQLPLITDAAGRAAAAAGIPLSPLGEAGVNPLASPAFGQAGTVLSPVSERVDEQLVVVVNIDGEELTAIIDRRVDAVVNTEVRRLMAGTRGI